MHEKMSVFVGMALIIVSVYIRVVNSEVTEENRVHSSRPNIVLLLADDIGYGDLGCYGNENVSTPHIDALARDGLRFTRMYSQPVCSPTRASILTGRYPVRYGILKDHSAHLPFLSLPVFTSNALPGGIPMDEKPTLSDMLSSFQYRTGFIGKWHLGVGKEGIHLPVNYGFDSFYGIPETHFTSCSNDPRFRETDFRAFFVFVRKGVSTIVSLLVGVTALCYLRLVGKKVFTTVIICTLLYIAFLRIYSSFTLFNPKSCILMKNNDIIEQPYKEENMTLRFTKKAVDFISLSGKVREPFFLFMSYLQNHYPPIVSPRFRNTSGQGIYYDSLMEMDWSVGTIVRTLRDLNISNNTLVIFASDNGAELVHPVSGDVHDPDTHGFNGYILTADGKTAALRGHKQDVWEGGIRIPAIFSWPGVIAPGKKTHSPTNLMDIFPTISDIVGVNVQGKRFDGKNLVPILKQPETRSPHDSMMHYCDTEGVSAVTLNRYKVHFRSCSGEVFNPPLLYDIEKDPGESNPLSLSHHEKVLSEVQSAIEHHQSTLTPVPSQLSELLRPWLYLCYNWPFCTKTIEEEERFDDLFA